MTFSEPGDRPITLSMLAFGHRIPQVSQYGLIEKLEVLVECAGSVSCNPDVMTPKKGAEPSEIGRESRRVIGPLVEAPDFLLDGRR
jgi:hypothetical protein